MKQIFFIFLLFLISCSQNIEIKQNEKQNPNVSTPEQKTQKNILKSLFLQKDDFILHPKITIDSDGKKVVYTDYDILEYYENRIERVSQYLQKSMILKINNELYFQPHQQFTSALKDAEKEGVMSFKLKDYTPISLEIPDEIGSKKSKNDELVDKNILLQKKHFDTNGNKQLDELLKKSTIFQCKGHIFIVTPQERKAILLKDFEQKNNVTFHFEDYPMLEVAVPIQDNFYQKYKNNESIQYFVDNEQEEFFIHTLEGYTYSTTNIQKFLQSENYSLLENFIFEKQNIRELPYKAIYTGTYTFEKVDFIRRLSNYLEKHKLPPIQKQKLLKTIKNIETKKGGFDRSISENIVLRKLLFQLSTK
ncbi:hypothetical protein KGV52_00160 [Candidatus Gracilibacteria bacterium]|nr:hypothetical protein [Candidatus Gracilibacteria bacterium]